MKLIYLIFALTYSLSTSLFSWHYNCHGEQAVLLYDNISISGQPFLIFNFKDIYIKLLGDQVQDIPVANKNILITAPCDDINYSKIWIELPQDDSEDYVEFVGRLFIEDGLGKVRLLRLNCLAQRVIR